MPRYSEEFKEQVVRKMMPPGAKSVHLGTNEVGIVRSRITTFHIHAATTKKRVLEHRLNKQVAVKRIAEIRRNSAYIEWMGTQLLVHPCGDIRRKRRHERGIE